MHSLVFDLGGTFIRSAVALDDGRLYDVARERIPNVFSGEGAASVYRRIVDMVSERVEGCSRANIPLDGIVISFPGPIRNRRLALAAPTISGSYSPPDIASTISERTNLPVHLVNDVSAAAWHIGERIDVDRFLVLTISSGIGSKLYDRTSVARVIDEAPYAGEIGHVTVDYSPDAVLCDCGERGHLGAIASGRGAERLARARAEGDRETFALSACATRYGATSELLTNERHLVPAVCDRDPWACTVIREAMRPLAIVLNAVVHACALERIVVIGGFAGALGDWYVDELQALMETASAPAFGLPHDLVQAWETEQDVCLYGAAAFARTVPAFA